MDYEKKMINLRAHIEKHPNDYQAVIGLLKANSDAIASQIRNAQIERLQKVAKYRREYNAEQKFE